MLHPCSPPSAVECRLIPATSFIPGMSHQQWLSALGSVWTGEASLFSYTEQQHNCPREKNKTPETTRSAYEGTVVLDAALRFHTSWKIWSGERTTKFTLCDRFWFQQRNRRSSPPPPVFLHSVDWLSRAAFCQRPLASVTGHHQGLWTVMAFRQWLFRVSLCRCNTEYQRTISWLICFCDFIRIFLVIFIFICERRAPTLWAKTKLSLFSLNSAPLSELQCLIQLTTAYTVARNRRKNTSQDTEERWGFCTNSKNWQITS